MGRIIEVLNQEYPDFFLDEIVFLLKTEKIIIMPSDTIYGFLALPSLDKRLRKIKKRDKKPFLYLISDIYQLESMGVDIAVYIDIFNKYWPGPVTLIIKTNEKKTIGVRMPDWYILQNIINNVGAPLISSSVNYAGAPLIKNEDDIIQEFGDKVELIVVDRSYKSNKASTIIDITKKPFKIIRKGNANIHDF